MENSCREKYKPSPKKWILASRQPKFRRNSALIPANAGLFHYAGNNPVRYTDPDGREESTSELTKSELEIYKAARQKLLHTLRGSQVMTKIRESKTVYKVKINNAGINGYDPKGKIIHWDPKKILVSGDCNEISPESLLQHELGHAYQDEKKPLPLEPKLDEKLQIEDENVFLNELPVTVARGEGKRIDYLDWIYSVRDGYIYNVNTGFIGPKPKQFYDKSLKFMIRPEK